MLVSIETLLEYLSLYGGQIISTKDLQPHWIEQARASNRMYVNEKSLGYVWEPYFKEGMPTTEKEAEEFDKWYPLETPLPEELRNSDWLFERLNKIKPLKHKP